ncbi:pilus assembly FimT family protein [Ferrimonas marina]|uniref:Type IV fimbrial biogenesis protein FimT n=1 Tax=Ferrimonas marina TaxID=299255 RepID=A0A1M5VWM9_9GAMM|nr:prepilin-type N-terminal cleavage/methylation domain-containing protein [Ferrimonas marina]SHH79618.1 type IV fimbrial biogenesis protein FimT [Ferrimonas marina]
MIPTTRRRPAKGSRGLTLVNLLVALAILAILLAIAMPSFTDMAQKLRLRGAAFQLLETVHQGKSEAIKRNLDSISLKFINETGGGWCYRLTDVPNSCTACALVDGSGNPIDQTNKCDINGDGIVRGGDSSAFSSVTATANFGGNTTLSVPGRRNSFTAGNGRFALGDDLAICVVTSNVGRARICTPNDKGTIWGVDACGGTVCAN